MQNLTNCAQKRSKSPISMDLDNLPDSPDAKKQAPLTGFYAIQKSGHTAAHLSGQPHKLRRTQSSFSSLVSAKNLSHHSSSATLTSTFTESCQLENIKLLPCFPSKDNIDQITPETVCIL